MKKIISCLLLSIALSGVHAQENQMQLTSEDKACLVDALYHEARGEPEKGIFAVASVILHRAEHEKFPDSICDVVYQKGQFTFKHRAPKHEKDALAKVKSVANAIAHGFVPDYKFKFFHRHDVKGMCSNKKSKKIGSHVFC